MLLPLIVVVASVGSSIAVMVQAESSEAGLWKTSILAALFHGLEDSVVDAQKHEGTECSMPESFQQMDAMKETARVVEFRLQAGEKDDCARFVPVDGIVEA